MHPPKAPAIIMTFQPRHMSFAPRLGEGQEDKEEELPGAGSCRLLSRVAGSGAKPKVNHHLISPLPSWRLYPRMSGLNPEPNLRPDLSSANPSSTPGALMSREQPLQLGLAEVWPGRVQNLPGPGSSKPREQPHPGSAKSPRQPMLQQRPLPEP